MTANSGVPQQFTHSPNSQEDLSTIDLSILDKDASVPIAVVGLGFRGPGDATDVDKLWAMIREGREAWSPIPRWNNSAFYHPDHSRHGTINVEGGHFLQEDVALFDAPFFNMTSDEAAAMDPQQRLLLEVTYEALESAGMPLSTIMGTQTSCFVGSFNADYTDLLLRDPDCIPMYQCTNAGQSRAMTANRISYFFDLKGPSVTVDTACSGSLVALHLACQSLRTSDATMAIAAGVNVILSHEFMSTMTMMKFLSLDGRCRTFDEDADGYARGEAIGCLILKPLRDAICDGDPIRAIIRGSGSNQDGRTAGITLPSGTAQEALIRHVYRTAGLDPLGTEFIEAHGTGTQAGDPIETGALAKVFGPRNPKQPLRVGSIKTNVGHLEGTSGVAGVIKAILMLERRMLLPNRNFKRLNRRILAEEWDMKVQLEYEPWETPGPHRVSVNSFGYGGSNAHIILEDAFGYLSQRNLTTVLRPQDWKAVGTTTGHQQVNRPRIFMLSAFDEIAMTTQIRQLHSFFEAKDEHMSDEWMNNLAYTLNERRTAHLYRAAVIGESVAKLKINLNPQIKIYKAPKKPTLGFVFTGQGAQWSGMGKELLELYPVFRESIGQIDSYLGRIGAHFNVIDEILKPKDISRLSHPLISQPICSALQIALVDLLASWGIHPDAVTGHSSGEIAAAYAAGILRMEDAITVAYFRGVCASRLFERQSSGAMMAVGMSALEVEPYVRALKAGRATVACVNSPSSVTISGDSAAIEELGAVLQERQVFARHLAVEVAYHSHHMELIGGEYLECIAHINPRSPSNNAGANGSGPAQFFSSVTGSEVAAAQLGPYYWVQNLLGQVKFVESLQSLCFGTNISRMINGISDKKRGKRPTARKVGIDTLIEIGPHSALAGPIKQILKANSKLDRANVTYNSVIIRNMDATLSALTVAASLACTGYPVNFQAANDPTPSGDRRVLVDLPPYGWNHTRSYWAEPRVSKVFRKRRFPRTDILGVSEGSSCPSEPRWKNYLRVSETPWLRDHKIQSNIIYPAAGYIAMAIEAASQLSSTNDSSDQVTTFHLRDISILSALVIRETSPAEVTISLRECVDTSGHVNQLHEFKIYSVTADDQWTEHCNGYVGIHQSQSYLTMRAAKAHEPLSESSFSVLDVPHFYEHLAAVGLEYGPCFANITNAHFTKDTSLVEIAIPDTASVMPLNFEYPCVIHPCTLDAIIHSVFVNIDLTNSPAIPVHIDELTVGQNFPRESGSRINVCTQTDRNSRDEIEASISAGADEGPTLLITGLRCRYVGHRPSESTARQIDRLAYKLLWNPDPDLVSENDIPKLLRTKYTGCLNPESQPVLQESAIRHVQTAVECLRQGQYDSLPQARKPILEGLAKAANRVHQGRPADKFEHSSPDHELCEPVSNLLSTIGRNLGDILLSGQPDSTLFSETDWEAYWNSLCDSHLYQNAAQFLKLLSHKNPMMSVLEVEAGEGITSCMFLQSLTDAGDNTPKCGQYTLALQNSDKIQTAAERLSHWGEWVSFRNLDLSKDIESQGFIRGSYDIVVVPYGLYSVESVPDAIRNIQSLLRPGGYLIMVNPMSGEVQLPNAVIVSALPEARLRTLEYSKTDLGNLFKEAHFVGCDSWLDLDETLPMIARKNPNLAIRRSMHVLLIVDNGDCGVCISHLQDLLQSSQCTVEVTDIQHAQAEGMFCLVLTELKSSLLTCLEKSTLATLKQMFQNAAGILWVTRGGSGISTSPDSSLITGFTRTARSESGVDPILTLDLDDTRPLDPEAAAEAIFHLFQGRMLHAGSISGDSEYVERDGMLLIPRVMEDAQSNERLASLHDNHTINDELFHFHTRPLRAVLNHTVGSGQVYFAEDERMIDALDDHICISVQAVCLSKVGSQNEIEEARIGSGYSGVVHAVGRNVHDFAVGDIIACLGPNAVSNVYQAKAAACQRITSPTSVDQAAAIPAVYSMVYYAVHQLAHLASSNRVLIFAAGNIIGQAFTEICKASDAHILAVVENLDEITALRALGVSEDHVLLNRDGAILEDLVRMSNDEGVDVIINCADDPVILNRLWKCARECNRVIQVCASDTKRGRWEVPSSSSGVVFATISQDTLWRLKSHLRDEIWSRVGKLLREGKIRGPSLTTHNMADISTALEALRSDRKQDFIVVNVGPNDHVKVIRSKQPNSLFRADVSYMLIGGLGGIGRATALWMAKRGARNIILINRTGLTRASSRKTVEELESEGVRAFVRAVDIADRERAAAAFAELANTAPPVRGVIQAAMVLKDTLIEKMSLDEYHSVLQPKYSGTWNLHSYLPQELDWFIMLSSISGIIGNATQAAYAAGSTFMDAFAAYRNSLGLHAVSIDLGVITDVGYLAENTELAAKMAEQGFHGTDTKTVMSLIELAMTTSPQSDSTHSSHLITGLGTWKEGHSLPNFDTPLFSHFRRRFQSPVGGNQTGSSTSTLRDDLKAAKSLDEASGLVLSALSAKVAAHLAVPVDSISPSNPVTEYGIDSHAAVELRNWILKTADSTVPILEILATGSMMELAAKIATKSTLVNLEE